MPARHDDWLKQARHDLAHARHACRDTDFEWACFAAQQAAEKALKSLYQKLGADVLGHSVLKMLSKLPKRVRATDALLAAAKRLDRHYIASRYPNSYPEGAPAEYYTKQEADQAIQDAETIVRFCQDHLA